MVNRNLYLEDYRERFLNRTFCVTWICIVDNQYFLFLSFVCLCVILLITLLLIQWIKRYKTVRSLFSSSRFVMGIQLCDTRIKRMILCKGLICGNESDYPPIQSKPE